MENILLMFVFLPAAVGIFLVASSFMDHRRVTLASEGKVNIPEEGNLKNLHILISVVMLISMAGVLYLAWTGSHKIVLCRFIDNIPIYFKIDGMGRLFVTIMTIIWACAAIYAFGYMKHEGEEKRFFGFFMIVYTVLALLYFAGNLVTLYFFYEMMSLTSMPLVFHNGSREAIMASLKYLFYSMCGAYLALFGIFYLHHHVDSFVFHAGGTLLRDCSHHKSILLIAICLMILGFGAKAGMFPLHAWLPTAHPVAPSPASAFLSAMIVKCGVFAIIRVIYYIVGPDFLRGTWVQYSWLTISLITVFMGSMMAYLEPVLKKRLAYSTVSQVSYITFGLFTMTSIGVTGALLHVVAHAFIKCGLFLCAGTFLFCFNKTRVKDLKGIGKKMPVLLWCWTFFALALIGIPPFSGFVSKWYLAQGALSADIGIFSYLGPAVLLISALLTAGYLFPIAMDGFLPGESFEAPEKTHSFPMVMVAPLVFLAAMSLIVGIMPIPFLNFFSGIIASII